MKLMFVPILLLLTLSLSSCGALSTDTIISSAESSSSESGPSIIVPEKETAQPNIDLGDKDEYVVFLQEGDANLSEYENKYLAYGFNTGVFLHPWDNPDEIAANKLIFFFYVNEFENYLNNNQPLANSELAIVPAEVVESYIMQFFSCSIDHLRSSSKYFIDGNYQFSTFFGFGAGHDDLVEVYKKQNTFRFTCLDLDGNLFNVFAEIQDDRIRYLSCSR